MKLVKIICVVFAISLLMGCLAENITADRKNTIKPSDFSGDRAEISKTLLSYQKAWNSKNIRKFMSFFHPQAKILTSRGKKGRYIVSKEKYETIALSRRNKAGVINLGLPQFTSRGDIIEVKVPVVFSNVRNEFLFVFDFIYKDKWLIKKSHF